MFSVDSSYHQQLRGNCWSVFGALAACAEHTDVAVSSHTSAVAHCVCKQVLILTSVIVFICTINR